MRVPLSGWTCKSDVAMPRLQSFLQGEEVSSKFLRNTVIKRGWQSIVIVIAFGMMSASGIHAEQAEQATFALKSGDKVVFYGDSITAQRLYTRFVEDFIVSRYPQMRIHFYNAGVSGDTVTGGHAGNVETRLRRDVMPWHPTLVTIMLGMNDGHYTTEFDKNFKAYESGYQQLVDDLKADVPEGRLTLIRPSPYDEIAHSPAISGYNSVMVGYGNFVSQLGTKKDMPVVDFNRALTDALTAGVRIDPQMAGSLLPDRIHPSPFGHWIMAAALVREWKISPIVSSVVVDASRLEIEGQKNTTVSGLTGTAASLQWTQLDEALPLPLELNDSMTQYLLKVSDIGALDQQLLRVVGLSAATYLLEIDGQKIGSFSRRQLADGVNLALYQTPMEQQAKSIDWTADDRSKLSGTRFRLLTDAGNIPSQQAAESALDALDEQMIEEEYKNAAPKPHDFVLTADKR
jgi:lysophospholipase L1-like esterase